MSSKVRYLATAAVQKFSWAPIACPSCEHLDSRLVARKYAVTELRRCRRCDLLFRTPVIGAAQSDAFYENGYSAGFTTELPDERRLAELLNQQFRGTEKDYSTYLAVLDALGVRANARILDYGCSWGYGTWQMRQRGFQADGFEISRTRSDFARAKLGLNVFDRLPEPSGSYDVFFSAHVLEHLPSVREAIAYGLASLKPSGLFVAFMPNGSEQYRRVMPKNWMHSWGLVHPNLLDECYFTNGWGNQAHALCSGPYPLDALRTWSANRERPFIGSLSGSELLAVIVAP